MSDQSSEIVRLQDAVAELGKSNFAKDTRYEGLEASYTSLEEVMSKEQSEHLLTKDKLVDELEAHRITKKELADIKIDLDDEKEDCLAALRRIQILETTEDAQKERIENFERLVKDLRQKITDANNKAQDQDSDNIGLSNQLTTSETKVTSLEGQLLAADDEIKSLNAIIDDLNDDVLQLKNIRAQVKDSLESSSHRFPLDPDAFRAPPPSSPSSPESTKQSPRTVRAPRSPPAGPQNLATELGELGDDEFNGSNASEHGSDNEIASDDVTATQKVIETADAGVQADYPLLATLTESGIVTVYDGAPVAEAAITDADTQTIVAALSETDIMTISLPPVSPVVVAAPVPTLSFVYGDSQQTIPESQILTLARGESQQTVPVSAQSPVLTTSIGGQQETTPVLPRHPVLTISLVGQQETTPVLPQHPVLTTSLGGQQETTPVLPQHPVLTTSLGGQQQTTPVSLFQAASPPRMTLSQFIGNFKQTIPHSPVQAAAPQPDRPTEVIEPVQDTTTIPAPVRPAALQVVYINRPVCVISNHNPFKCWISVEVNFVMLIVSLIVDAWFAFLLYLRPVNSANSKIRFAGSPPIPRGLLREVLEGDIDVNDAAHGQSSQPSDTPTAGVADADPKVDTGLDPSDSPTAVANHTPPNAARLNVRAGTDPRSTAEIVRAAVKWTDAHQSERDRRKDNWFPIVVTFLQHCIFYLFVLFAVLTIVERKYWFNANEATRSFLTDLLAYRANVDIPGFLETWFGSYWDHTIRMGVLNAIQFFTNYHIKSNRIPG